AASTTAVVVSDINPSAVGQNVVLTATVTTNAPGSGVPVGTVQFFDGATALNAVGIALNGSGQATLTTAFTVAGFHNITVQYTATPPNFTNSTSGILKQFVGSANSVTTLAAPTPASTVFGQSFSITATVTGAGVTPTGTVTFIDGSTPVGTVALTAGSATFTSSSFAVGTHTLKAMYSGDLNYTPSTSGTQTETVAKAATTIAVVTSGTPSNYGALVTFTATLAVTGPGAGTPTGSVEFFDSTTKIGTSELNGLTATLSTSALSVGAHSITVKYVGDAGFATSTSSAITQTVNAAPTTTTIATSLTPSVWGQAVT